MVQESLVMPLQWHPDLLGFEFLAELMMYRSFLRQPVVREPGLPPRDIAPR